MKQRGLITRKHGQERFPSAKGIYVLPRKHPLYELPLHNARAIREKFPWFFLLNTPG